jgi:hypothetical protein
MTPLKGPVRPQRHLVSLFVGTSEQDTVPFGRARDLSVTGIFLETPARPEVGSVRELVFVWGEDTFIVSARIVRHTPDGIGLAFINPDSTFRNVIQEILETSPAIEIASAKGR